jgi:hypothetical protein
MTTSRPRPQPKSTRLHSSHLLLNGNFEKKKEKLFLLTKHSTTAVANENGKKYIRPHPTSFTVPCQKPLNCKYPDQQLAVCNCLFPIFTSWVSFGSSSYSVFVLFSLFLFFQFSLVYFFSFPCFALFTLPLFNFLFLTIVI